MAAAPAAAPAAPAGPIPGWNAGKTRIENPTLFLESVLETLPGVKALFDAAATKDERPTFTKVTGELGIDDSTKNQKKYMDMPILNLSRLSSSGDDSHCWFDSFLQCMSPKYRTLSNANRNTVFHEFRLWCRTNKDILYKVSPNKIYNSEELAQEYLISKAEFMSDLTNTGSFINAMTGFVIAWYFGVNVVYIYTNSGNLEISNQSAYQSETCKTIFIYFIRNHFEPIGAFNVDSTNKQDETRSKLLFDWTDPRLCAMKVLSTLVPHSYFFRTQREWRYPEVCNDPDSLKAVTTHVRNIETIRARRYASERPVNTSKQNRAVIRTRLLENLRNGEKDSEKNYFEHLISTIDGGGVAALVEAIDSTKPEKHIKLSDEYANKYKPLLDIARAYIAKQASKKQNIANAKKAINDDAKKPNAKMNAATIAAQKAAAEKRFEDAEKEAETAIDAALVELATAPAAAEGAAAGAAATKLGGGRRRKGKRATRRRKGRRITRRR